MCTNDAFKNKCDAWLLDFWNSLMNNRGCEGSVVVIGAENGIREPSSNHSLLHKCL